MHHLTYDGQSQDGYVRVTLWCRGVDIDMSVPYLHGGLEYQPCWITVTSYFGTGTYLLQTFVVLPLSLTPADMTIRDLL